MRSKPRSKGRNHLVSTLRAVGLALTPLLASAQQNQAWLPDAGHGTFSVAYQDLHVQYHTDSHGNKVVPGTIDNHVLFLDFDYGLTDRLALSVGLPYKSNRFVGKGIHDPGRLDDGHGQLLVDDGRYHSGWSDVNLALRYRWLSEPWVVTPFISYGKPSRDYTTFGHAAVGNGQQRLELGVNAGRRFVQPLQNLYFQASYGYAVMQEVDHRRVNHSMVRLELGYLLTPRLTAWLLLVGQKTYNGLDFPEDYPLPRRDEHFFAHDQNVRNDFVNIGAGLSYRIIDHYSLFTSYGRTLWGENSHLLDYAVTFGISRGF